MSGRPEIAGRSRMGVRNQVGWIPCARNQRERQTKPLFRKRKSFNRQYQHVFDALRDLPQNTVVDGEIVALDDAGRPNFNFLQHSRSQAKRIHYFVFDLLVYENRDLMHLSFVERREILKSEVKFQSPRVRTADYFETPAATMLQSAREQDLEGVVAKRKNSLYEAGKRSGAWAKFRLNSG